MLPHVSHEGKEIPLNGALIDEGAGSILVLWFESQGHEPLV